MPLQIMLLIFLQVYPVAPSQQGMSDAFWIALFGLFGIIVAGIFAYINMRFSMSNKEELAEANRQIESLKENQEQLKAAVEVVHVNANSKLDKLISNAEDAGALKQIEKQESKDEGKTK